MRRIRILGLVSVLSMLGSMFLALPNASAQQLLLPDLVSDPPVPVNTEVLNTGNGGPGQLVVRFHGYVTNLGDGPLDIAGNPQLADPNNPDSHQVYQRALRAGSSRYDESNFVNLSKARVQYETDDGHNHFHLMEIARYSLWNDNRSVEVAPGSKVGFCLYDIAEQGARHPNPGPYFYSGSVVQWCDSNQPLSTDIRMGTTEGWRDTYSSFLTFQWVDISDVAPGQYWLAAESDTANRIVETNEANNAIAYSATPTIVDGYLAQPVNVTSQGGSTVVPLANESFGSVGQLRYMVTQAPANGSLNVPLNTPFTASSLTYTPNQGFGGTDTFRYVAINSASSFPLNPPAATAQISVPNAASVAISGAPASMLGGTSVDLDATVTNAAPSVNWTVNGVAGGNATVGTITSAGVYTAPGSPPPAGAATIRATSTQRPAAFDQVTIAITATNTAPSIAAVGNQSSTVGQADSLQLSANDPGDTVTWTATNLPQGLSITAAGLISGTPQTPSTRSVTVTATDSGGLTDTQTFQWTVSPAQAGGLTLVTTSSTYNAGWVLRNNTKQWISSSCRSQLEAAGGSFAVTAYNTFGSLAPASPTLSCAQVQTLLTPAGPIPTRPTNLVASVVNGQVVLQWSASSDDNGLREYEIKRDDVWVGYTPAPGTTWTDTNPTGVHLYQVRAVDFDLNYGPPAAITVDVTPNNSQVRLVTTSSSYSAGWAIVNGTKQWINAACRSQLVAAGGSFSITPYNDFGSLPPASPTRSCTQLANLLGNPNPATAALVTTSSSYTAGWLLTNNTKQWLSPTCRAQLEAGGAAFVVTPYNDFGSLPATTSPLNCNQIAALI